MSEPATTRMRRGACLCRAVLFELKLRNDDVHICHCTMCQRWSGGVFLGLEAVTQPNFTSETALGVYQSSDWAERLFCTKCGTSLFWRSQDGAHWVVSAQAIEDGAHCRLESQIFIDEKPNYYNFAEPTQTLTGAEFMAMRSPNAD
ncbi:MAG: GFA family protein [Hyphomicrobiaceae bacterium]